MQRILYLLRHAKSDWSKNVPDFDRPLNRRGRRSTDAMGQWMLQHDALPKRIVSSPAQRAKQTALKICVAANIDERVVEWDERIYEADLETLLYVLADYADEPQSIMLVGHNPGFETLVRYLAGSSIEKHERLKLMPTAALAKLNMPLQWGELDQGSGKLISITRPKEIA